MEMIFEPERKQAHFDDLAQNRISVINVANQKSLFERFISPVEFRLGKDLLQFKLREEILEILKLLPCRRANYTKMLSTIRSYIKWALDYNLLDLQEYLSHPAMQRYLMKDIALDVIGNNIVTFKDAEDLVKTLESVAEPDERETTDVKAKCLMYASYIGIPRSKVCKLETKDFSCPPRREFSGRWALGGFTIPMEFKPTFAVYIRMTGERRPHHLTDSDILYSYHPSNYFFKSIKGETVGTTAYSTYVRRFNNALNKLPGQVYHYDFDSIALEQSKLFCTFRELDLAMPDVSRFQILAKNFPVNGPNADPQCFIGNYILWLARYYPDEIHLKSRIEPREI